MSAFPGVALPTSAISAVWQESSVSAAVNSKSEWQIPGVYWGLTPSFDGTSLILGVDESTGTSVAVVASAGSADGKILMRFQESVTLDFSGHVFDPSGDYVVADAVYSKGAQTVGAIRTQSVSGDGVTTVNICRLTSASPSGIHVTPAVDRHMPYAYAGVEWGFMPGGSLEEIETSDSGIADLTDEVHAARDGFAHHATLDTRLTEELALSGTNGLASRLSLSGFSIQGTKREITTPGWPRSTHPSSFADANVSSDFATRSPDGSMTAKGVITNAALDNRVIVKDENYDDFIAASGDLVYGRLTYASSVIADDLDFQGGLVVKGTGAVDLMVVTENGDLLRAPDGSLCTIADRTDDRTIVLVADPSVLGIMPTPDVRRYILTFYADDTAYSGMTSVPFYYWFQEIFDESDRPIYADAFTVSSDQLAADVVEGSTIVYGKLRLATDLSTAAGRAVQADDTRLSGIGASNGIATTDRHPKVSFVEGNLPAAPGRIYVTVSEDLDPDPDASEINVVISAVVPTGAITAAYVYTADEHSHSDHRAGMFFRTLNTLDNGQDNVGNYVFDIKNTPDRRVTIDFNGIYTAFKSTGKLGEAAHTSVSFLGKPFALFANGVMAGEYGWGSCFSYTFPATVDQHWSSWVSSDGLGGGVMGWDPGYPEAVLHISAAHNCRWEENLVELQNGRVGSWGEVRMGSYYLVLSVASPTAIPKPQGW